MHAYRFRILIDEQDDFVREIDLLANHTFEDFHKAIFSSVGFDGNELASFFICDHRWRKLKEFTLIDMQPDKVFDDDDEDIRDRKSPIPVQLMINARIKEAINDPHQRLIYEYDFLHPKTFFIELLKIVAASPSETYPQVFRSEGVVAKVATHQPLIFDELDEGFMLPDIESLDDEFVVNDDEMGLGPEDQPMW
ncbi:MAG: hypothetical protein U1C46_12265 [Bacteroidales bacterium]|nr:hypothetical protein [Bacteroidales bacterium]MDZ4205574.1 hypothetical protein [Bacteroidales bacterium]